MSRKNAVYINFIKEVCVIILVQINKKFNWHMQLRTVQTNVARLYT